MGGFRDWFFGLLLETIYFCWSGAVEFLFWIWFSFVRRQRLPPLQNPILLESATSLAAKIRTGEVKSVDVVQAYIDRVSEVQPVLNAVVERRFEDALREATKADDLVRARTKTPEELAKEFPLLGVPFTVKNSIGVKGMLQDAGSVYCKGLRADQDSAAVSLLVRAGAIPLALTNIPEMWMAWDTYNKLYGSTKNPYDTRRTPGGSSGGEAALIAAAGSLMGIGTDISGSIRIPSLFCGIFGHKPTAGMVSMEGVFPDLGGTLSDYNCLGPMCRYAEDLPLMLGVLAGANAVPLQLTKPVDVNLLQVYYTEDDGSTISSVGSDSRKAIREVCNLDLFFFGFVLYLLNNEFKHSSPLQRY